MIKKKNLDPSLVQWILANAGIGPVGDIRYLVKTSGNTYQHLKDNKVNPAEIFHKISEAEQEMTTYQNDVVLVSPDSHVWYGDTHSTGEALTWDKSCSHLIGMCPHTLGGGMRARFGHSGATMANFMTVSGNNNLFKNLYWMHGSSTGGASDVTCLTISGHRNKFDGCNFAGPMDGTQAQSANYAGMVISGSHNHFKNCTFGVSNLNCRNSASTMLKITGGSANIYENCLFLSKTAATTPYFINVTLTTELGLWMGIFLNCQFLNALGTYQTDHMADAIAFSGTPATARTYLYFDNRCSFAGVTNLAPNTKGGLVLVGSAGATGDAAAISDDKYAGIAQESVES